MNDYVDREKMAENEIDRIEKDYNDLVMKNILIKYELKLKNEILLASWNEYIEKKSMSAKQDIVSFNTDLNYWTLEAGDEEANVSSYHQKQDMEMFKEAFEAGWESAMIHMVLDEVL